MAWVLSKPGFPLTADAVFKPSSVEASIATAKAEGSLSAGSAKTYGSRLNALARAGAPRAGHAPDSSKPAVPPTAPYSESDIAALRGVLGAFDEEDRLHVLGAMALAFGAGVCGAGEGGLVEGGDVVERDGMVVVVVKGGRAREVAVRPEWVADLLAVRSQRPAGPLTRFYEPTANARICRTLRRCSGVPWLVSNRMRNTWIVGHLGRGVPADVVGAGAGLARLHLDLYFRFLPLRPQAERDAWLGSAEPCRPPATPPAS
jgi:hypothetical protein